MDIARARALARHAAKRTTIAASSLLRDEVARDDAVGRLDPFTLTTHLPPTVELAPSPQHGPIALYDDVLRSSPPHPDLVHELPAEAIAEPVRLTRYGGLRIGRELYDLDFGTGSGALELPFARSVHVAGDVVAPWSHHWGDQYYDWVVMVLAKLLRIEEAIGPRRWSSATIALSHAHRPFARWYLGALGVLDRVVEPTSGPRLAPETTLVGTNQPWSRPSRQDLLRLGDRFAGAGAGHEGLGPLVYVQRRGRRRLRNERELLPVLARHGVVVMEDGRHSVPEQIAIFRDARVVVAPHGAGLTNLVHAQPGTTVLELLGGGYHMDCFRWMAGVLGMDHHVLAVGGTPSSRTGIPEVDHLAAVDADLEVDPRALDGALRTILGAGARGDHLRRTA